MTRAHRRILQVRVLKVPWRVRRVPHCKYSECPTAGASAPPAPTVEAVDDSSTPPHAETAAHPAGVKCAANEYSKVPTVSTPSTHCEHSEGDTAAHTAGVSLCRLRWHQCAYTPGRALSS